MTIRMSDPDCLIRVRLWMLAAYDGDELTVDDEELARAALRVRHGKQVRVVVTPPTPAEIARRVGQDCDEFD